MPKQGTVRLDRFAVEKCTVEEADEASGWKYWKNHSPQERLRALEQLRSLMIKADDDGNLPRLQRVLTVVERGEYGNRLNESI